MWTHSHFLITGLLAERLVSRGRRLSVGALLAGSVLPDAPLVVLTLGSAGWRRLTGVATPGEGLYAPGFDELFFKHPVWVALHNALHAPFVLLVLAAIGWAAAQERRAWGAGLLWFAVGCALHAAIDIATHYRDGPLVLFPFDWTYRVRSPISYWQPEHFGAFASRVELLLDAAIAGYLAALVVRRRRSAPLGSARDS